LIGRTQRTAALHTVLTAWNNYGDRGFRVDLAGKHYRPLKDAETLGWVTFLDRDRAAITDAGKVQAMQYAPAMVEA
jgi:hypothetical protein